MRVVILCSDDIFAGMLMYPLIQRGEHEVLAILQQRDVMMPGKTPWQMFKRVTDQSGWHYALYQAIQTKVYELILQLNGRLPKPSQLAAKHHITYRVFDRIHSDSTLSYLSTLQPDVILSLRFSQIIKKPLLAIPKYGILNFHASMLPKYRGLGSVFQAIAHGDKEIGYTLHFVDEDIDTGNILLQYRLAHQTHKSVSYHYVQLHLHGGLLICDALQYLESPHQAKSIDSEQGSYFSWPKKQAVQTYIKRGGKLITLSDLLWMLFQFKPIG